jgi:branched-chain amino acid transport system ATP-binding protein
MHTSTETLLEVDDLHTSYGNSQVLFGLSLKMKLGETATLLGRGERCVFAGNASTT